MDYYRCRMCGYRYLPEKGDPKGKVEANTSFKHLPDNWRCPVCRAKQSSFKIIEND